MTDRPVELARDCEYWAHELFQIWGDTYASLKWGDLPVTDFLVTIADFEARLATAKAELIRELSKHDPD